MARRSHSDDWWVDLTVVVLIIFAYLLYGIAKIVWAVFSEALLVYKDLGFAKSSTGRTLRLALGMFVAVVVAGTLAATTLPSTAGLDFTVVACAFLGWTTTVAICGWSGRSLSGDPGSLDAYVSYGKGRGRRKSA